MCPQNFLLAHDYLDVSAKPGKHPHKTLRGEAGKTVRHEQRNLRRRIANEFCGQSLGKTGTSNPLLNELSEKLTWNNRFGARSRL